MRHRIPAVAAAAVAAWFAAANEALAPWQEQAPATGDVAALQDRIAASTLAAANQLLKSLGLAKPEAGEIAKPH